jgi:hypothetical protein
VSYTVCSAELGEDNGIGTVAISATISGAHLMGHVKEVCLVYS